MTQELCPRHVYLNGGKPTLIVSGDRCDICGDKVEQP